MSNGGPPNKWTSFLKSSDNTTTKTGAQVLQQLDNAAALGFTGQAIEIACGDGDFIFVAGYSKQD